MSNTLGIPTSAMKGPRNAVHPSNHGLLLLLPTELLVGTVAILDTANLEKGSHVYKPLPALRL
jgi:hypothetical protein